MTARLNTKSSTVPLAQGESVGVSSGTPWPSAYRGSKYSVVTDTEFEDNVLLKWKQRDLSVFTDPPAGLYRQLTTLGKENGLGSVRVTAGGEVLTKIQAKNYPRVEEAPVSEGWIPVYVGKTSGELEFGAIESNPTPPDEGVQIWPGFPFNHGERWSVRQDDKLVWRWRDYEFESAFDHTELINAYHEYRPTPGRLYITEHGHVWVNIPNDNIASKREQEVRAAVRSWRTQAEEQGNSSTLRLVNRRLVATSQTDDPADGYLPVHIGHLSEFDQGTVPRPVVDDETYFIQVGQYENVWE